MKSLRNVFKKRPHKVLAEALSARRTEEEILQLLVQHPEFDAVRRGGDILVSASKLGYAEVARQLLEKGVDANYCKLGWMPLHRAARYCDIEVVRLLLKSGANPLAGRYGAYPLSFAMEGQRLEVANLLNQAMQDAREKPEAPKQGGLSL